MQRRATRCQAEPASTRSSRASDGARPRLSAPAPGDPPAAVGGAHQRAPFARRRAGAHVVQPRRGHVEDPAAAGPVAVLPLLLVAEESRRGGGAAGRTGDAPGLVRVQAQRLRERADALQRAAAKRHVAREDEVDLAVGRRRARTTRSAATRARTCASRARRCARGSGRRRPRCPDASPTAPQQRVEPARGRLDVVLGQHDEVGAVAAMPALRAALGRARAGERRRSAAPWRSATARAVVAAVLDHDHLAVGRLRLRGHRAQRALERRWAPARRDDDGDRAHRAEQALLPHPTAPRAGDPGTLVSAPPMSSYCGARDRRVCTNRPPAAVAPAPGRAARPGRHACLSSPAAAPPPELRPERRGRARAAPRPVARPQPRAGRVLRTTRCWRSSTTTRSSATAWLRGAGGGLGPRRAEPWRASAGRSARASRRARPRWLSDRLLPVLTHARLRARRRATSIPS